MIIRSTGLETISHFWITTTFNIHLVEPTKARDSMATIRMRAWILERKVLQAKEDEGSIGCHTLWIMTV